MTEATGRTAADIVVSPPSTWDTAHLRGLLDILAEDREVHGNSWFIPGLQAIGSHRFGQWAHAKERSGLIRPMAKLVYRVLFAYCRNYLGFEIPLTTKIGRRVFLLHQHGVAIHPRAEIGDGCWIRQGVTIGLRWEGGKGDAYYAPPRLGKNVELGVASAVIGAVRVGDNVKVGPHAVITTDVPAGASVVAPPSRILRLR